MNHAAAFGLSLDVDAMQPLATLPIQLRSLWEKVSDLLGDDLSPLQREAMKIEPPSE